MQTLSVPYRIREQDKEALDRIRRVYSSAVRQACKASVPGEKGWTLGMAIKTRMAPTPHLDVLYVARSATWKRVDDCVNRT